jgi:hypothetical protein
MRLANIEASDMLDVIHYLFEQDVLFVSGEQVAYKDTFRKNLYENLYNSTYKYANKSELDGSYGMDALDAPLAEAPIEEDKIRVFSPREKTAKPYTPPTEVKADDIKPFGSVLDAPIG